ncbi:hypothetical protein SERLA73DRAFT_191225 [Serpula lacrymans var. lacrymans S7.3]|uniref:Galactose mutarotase-like protein n=2 Tax=Serpula lacrymans var. lacrymans TaxID=341189 RepID=F8QH48_SERL3|nr:uncharacterized protein SERLADRAFT_449005 [Serpula lacrymans var. lacrymans S7.9]EGN92376.1 hypothetical protein SERLA73DRAFT_191225 [Serpula lacrymans var. lacrymans S7.3]EGO24236.1 hypothetical protein SERLADRAFT_449005 [Serpula lacrymans var. lacrymans S7.9]
MAEFKPVLLSLPSLAPSLAVEVIPFGLTIHRIFVQVDGRTHDIVIGPEAPEDHTVVKYTNTIVGRYANRVPVGTHTVDKDGVSSQFTAITNESPQVSLHGGPTGFDQRAWTQLPSLSSATLFTPAEISAIAEAAPGESSAAIFTLTSEDGDQGYTGRLLLEVLIAVVQPGPGRTTGGAEHELGSVVIVYRAKVDEKAGEKVVTPINITQHWGFNLDASLKDGPDSLSVMNHNMNMKSTHVAELLPNHLPSGNYIPIAEADGGSGAHVHGNKRIGDGFPKGGYDDYYLLSPRPASASPHRIPLSSFAPSLDLVKGLLVGGRRDPVLELSSDRSGLAVEFDTNQAGLMFYTNNWADAKGYRKKIHGGSGVKGDGYIPQSAAFIEFHEPLSAFLYPTTTSTDTLLTSDEIYNNFVRADVILRRVDHTGTGV